MASERRLVSKPKPIADVSRASRSELKLRAEFLQRIRHYFAQQQVLEVQTPLLRDFAVSDPHLTNLSVVSAAHFANPRYLQTSPEAALKALLASGSGPIYQLSSVFRDDPIGGWHRQEFTMLEWYRVDFTLEQLLLDIRQLIAAAGITDTMIEVSTYFNVFQRYLSIDPFGASYDDLARCVRENVEDDFPFEQMIPAGVANSPLARDLLLDVLMGHCIQPLLGQRGFEFVIDYPASQAALANVKVDSHGRQTAQRAELFYGGVELANGYDELTDCAEFERRFRSDNQIRRLLDLPEAPIDEDLLWAMQTGLPASSGVAVGIDRLYSVYRSFTE